MLQTQCVSNGLLEILNRVMQDPLFSGYRLVGGTSLALQLGHRQSVDLDFFGDQPIDEDAFLSALHPMGVIQVIKKSKNILILTVNNIKVDFVHYSYPWLDPALALSGIRLATKKDIAAMKLNAIAGRGSKKDFIDLYYLLKEICLPDMLSAYQEKYKDGSVFMVQKSMTYFEDADSETSPIITDGTDWEDMKAEITKFLEKG
jgi:predicted nucleotidyltransferase component of viral defense system